MIFLEMRKLRFIEVFISVAKILVICGIRSHPVSSFSAAPHEYASVSFNAS